MDALGAALQDSLELRQAIERIIAKARRAAAAKLAATVEILNEQSVGIGSSVRKYLI
jgi:hypothetical protein